MSLKAIQLATNTAFSKTDMNCGKSQSAFNWRRFIDTADECSGATEPDTPVTIPNSAVSDSTEGESGDICKSVFSTSTLLAFRTAMCADKDDDGSVRKVCCQAKLPPATYESLSPKSIVVAPVRRHQIPQPLTCSPGSGSPLHRCTTADNVDNRAEVARASRSVLDKITEETLDSQFEKLVNCGIEQPEHVSVVMSEVFNTATNQNQHLQMYADICMRLEQDSRIAAVVEVAGHQHNFRRLLLDQCQAVLGQLIEPCDAKMLQDDEAILTRKQKALATTKLIGHLLVNGVLSSEFFVDCADKLVSNRSTCPEALESLAALMMVAAPTFDTAEWQHYDRLQTCFGTMRKLSKDKTIVARSRGLLRDVLDVREAGWPTSTKNLAVVHAASHQSDTTSHPAAIATPEQKAQDCGKDRASLEAAPQEAKTFDLRGFRINLSAILADLMSNRDVSGAVCRMRSLQVPLECQAEQYADLITRIVEEKRGPARRCAMAFVAGLGMNSEQPAFDRDQCLAGLLGFFEDVYPDLCNEVARLPAIVRSELTPTLCSVFPKAEIDSRLPPGARF